ncbi:DUF4097 family beta strand repeat-containing protein [Brachybacterium sp. FME24]|uniref:DUF4097 family beta strand repeat-containing protein n=1 Tax=Brachybacterium sp. FME24 TaxID=2742605 RepID=UPI0018676E30|nr:DUF4097 family beta strand repeat-containing protein [Brachybacterium sp. FME24]
MPTFPAATPIALAVDVPFASLHVVASDREDAVVTVLPTDPARSGSRRAAEEVQVEQRGDSITVTYPGSWKQFVLPFAAGTANITVELPSGSAVRGKTGSLLVEGALGAVDMTLSGGDARLDAVERLDLKVSAGSAVVGRIDGTTTVAVSAGSVRIGEIAGDGTIRASNGTTTVEHLRGTLEILGAHGDIAVGSLQGDLVAKSAHAGLRVGRLESGRATLTTSFGSVRNLLTPTDGPVQDEATAQIQASTRYGDIVVQRP